MTRITLKDLIDEAVAEAVATASPEDFVIPASQLRLVSGTPSDGQVQGAHFWSFDAAATEIVGLSGLVLPGGWISYAVDLLTVNPTADAGDVRWEYRTGLITPGSPIVSADFTVGANLTAGAQNAPAAQSLVASRAVVAGRHWFRIGRSGGNAADTKGGDAGLMAVIFKKVS